MSRSILCLQNCDFEEPGVILDWVKARNFEMTIVRADQANDLPDPKSFDGIIVLGAPVSPHDNDEWINREKNWLKNALTLERPLFGICFGAQLLAMHLGSTVTKETQPIIGWQNSFFVDPTSREQNSVRLFSWHSEYFSLPAKAVTLATSPTGSIDAFQFAHRVFGFATHLEITAPLVERFIEGTDFARQPGSKFDTVQSIKEMRESTATCVKSSLDFAFMQLDTWTRSFDAEA